jgi:hypothetical protein
LSERQFLLFSLWSNTFVCLNSTFNCVIFFGRNSILRREGMNTFINNLSGYIIENSFYINFLKTAKTASLD